MVPGVGMVGEDNFDQYEPFPPNTPLTSGVNLPNNRYTKGKPTKKNKFPKMSELEQDAYHATSLNAKGD